MTMDKLKCIHMTKRLQLLCTRCCITQKQDSVYDNMNS